LTTSSQTLTLPQAIRLAADYFNTGELQTAEKICRQVLQAQPENSGALYILALIAIQVENDEAAIALLQKAISSNPSVPDYYGNLGNLFKKQGQFAQTIHCYQQVLALQPNSIKAYNNLGNVFKAQNQLVEAKINFQRAIALKPDWPKAHFGYAVTLLKSGDFIAGWQEYEWRFRDTEIKKIPQLKHPLWDGSPLEGRRLLVHWEQGFGDTLQFIRYLYLIKGGTLIFAGQPQLKQLLESLPCLDIFRVNPFDEEPDIAYDVWMPLLSLPKLFGTTLETIPNQIPYLSPDAQTVETWQTQLAAYTGFKIGIVWAGSPTHANDRNRSCTLMDFAPLAKMPNVVLFSLQTGEATTQPLQEDMEMISLTKSLKDFSDTAAAIAALDLIISVDTAIVHLAGAMGQNVWVLLAFDSDWRWLTERHDSPWYSTMRLFRQTAFGNWGSVFDQVISAFENAFVPSNKKNNAKDAKDAKDAKERFLPF